MPLEGVFPDVPDFAPPWSQRAEAPECTFALCTQSVHQLNRFQRFEELRTFRAYFFLQSNIKCVHAAVKTFTDAETPSAAL